MDIILLNISFMFQLEFVGIHDIYRIRKFVRKYSGDLAERSRH
jgi:hypothetical protein